MSVVRVDVEPTVITDALSKSGRSLEEVKNRFNNYEKWINNEVNPTYNQLVDLSNFLRVPFGYLLLKSPVTEKLPLLEFRTIDTDSIQNPSRELIDTIHDMEFKQEWLRNSFIEDGKEPLNYVGMFKSNKNITLLEMAAKIREIFLLDEQWYEMANSNTPTFSILRNQFSKHGVIIMQNGTALNNTHRVLDINEFRAFTLVDEYAPFIFINSLDSNSGKTFSLLHELAHILLGINSLYNDDYRQRDKYTSKVEILCNKVAGELIAPTNIFIHKWNVTYKQEQNLHEKIKDIAKDFKVSKLIVARKAKDQNYIHLNQYNEIALLVKKEFEQSQNKRKGQSGGHPVNNALSRLDENFLQTLLTSTEHGETQFNEAYRLAGVGRGVFEDLSARLKGVR